MVENTNSKDAKNEVFIWKLKEDQSNKRKSGTDTISRHRKPDKNRLKLNCEECTGKVCKNCTAQSQYCVCQSAVLKQENHYEARVMMTKDLPTDSKEDMEISQQVTSCPILALDTNRFYCNYQEKTEWIEAKRVCDGKIDCQSKSDESEQICQNTALKKKILIPILCFFVMATIAGTIACACWKVCGCSKKNVADQEPDDKICKALTLIQVYDASPSGENLRKMQSKINNLSHQEQFALLQITKNITIKKETGLYRVAVEHVLRKKNNSRRRRTSMLKEIKLMDGQRRFKAELFSQAESSCLRKAKEYFSLNKDWCQSATPLWACKELLGLVLFIMMTFKRIIMTFLQEVKSVTLLITMKHFYSEILQERTNQIDDINLYDQWLFLVILYISHSILKQITTARLPLSDNMMIKLLQLVPFFTEAFLLLKIIGNKIEIYKLRHAIQTKIEKNSSTKSTSTNWKLIGKESLKLSKCKKIIDDKNHMLSKVDVIKSLLNAVQGKTLKYFCFKIYNNEVQKLLKHNIKIYPCM